MKKRVVTTCMMNLLVALTIFSLMINTPVQAQTITFTGGELLGKPTDTSITINIVPDTTIDYYYEYGTASGVYTDQTATMTATGGQPHEVTITGLSPNTRYYYRMQYQTSGGSWVAKNEHSFMTQRAPGSTFSFTITSDSHAKLNLVLEQAMQNVMNSAGGLPDFHFDLGDTFMGNTYMDGDPTTQSEVDDLYLAYRDPKLFGAIGGSVPIFLTTGNHEEEEGWNLDDTPFSAGVASIQARKAFYPTPVDEGPGGFYSGNTDPLAAIDETVYGDEFREDYYAWEWGDALFVVIDEFQYTMDNSYGTAAGENPDDPVTGDQWSWTLGAQQFNWFKQTLENSTAKYKFVFSHNMLGGITDPIIGVPPGYVRGGAEAAAYFEWGGNNADGTPGFNDHRDPAEFGTVPVHQLMVDNGVSAYFHGHDHMSVYERRDNIVYQEVSSPSAFGGLGEPATGFPGIYEEGDFGDYQTIKILPNPGHLQVTVTPDQAIVSYIRCDKDDVVPYTYTIQPNDAPSTDVVPPLFSLVGEAEMTLNLGDPYIEPGATAYDNVDGDISSTVVIGGDTVNVNTVGDYTLTYDVQDAAGNAAAQITRVVHVIDSGMVGFRGEELLGKPTDTSITINIVPNRTIDYYYEYGTASGVYTAQTSTMTATAGQPHEVTITGLTPNTQYYYRMQYRVFGGSWVARDEHSFWNQRASGSTFSFTVTSDSHARFNIVLQQTIQNIINDGSGQPDFHLDLGNTFLGDTLYSGLPTSQSAVDEAYLAYREPEYFGAFGGSVPIFLTAGNHEDEEGWNLDDTPFSIGVGSIQARKAFYPTPVDEGLGGFYSGNTDPLAAIDETVYGDELREDYYAWEWGDALFVVIDEYQYTMDNPYGAVKGEAPDDPATGDQWSWTLGAQQFNWFKQTLENSTAKYKFVFSHQMLGGIPRDVYSLDPVSGNFTTDGPGYVHGGAEAAGYFEWGGDNADGNLGFFDHRDPAEFGRLPVHQLMVANGVSAYFHGHDYSFAHETRDGIVYQEIPSASGFSGIGTGNFTYFGLYTEGDYGAYQTVRVLPNAGHVQVTVAPDQATVSYIRSDEAEAPYTYTIQPNDSSTDILPPVITLLGDPVTGVLVGDPYTDAGATAYDYVDGDITSDIVVGGDVIDITTPAGVYTITYDVQDAAGNPANQVTRTVYVMDEPTLPIITLLGDPVVITPLYAQYNDAGATAYDYVDGNLTSDIVVDWNPFNIYAPGIYTVTYDVQDSEGNAAEQVTRTVIVVDTTIPLLKLLGAPEVTVLLGTVYIDEGAVAYDLVDGDITSDIVVGGDTVDVDTAGTYTITYDVQDSEGNPAPQVMRTVIVVESTLPTPTPGGGAIPEPASIVFFGIGLCGILFLLRKRLWRK